MSENRAQGKARASLASLLRFLLTADGQIRCPDRNAAVLVAEDGKKLVSCRAVIAEAIRLGLVLEEGETLKAAPEARNHLRRMLAAGQTSFTAQHRDLAQTMVLHDGRRETATVNRLESPLSALARLRDRSGAAFLPETAIAAGERLHADFLRGGLQPRMTMHWEPRLATRATGEAGAARDITDTALEARARVARAVEAVGPELSGVALDVCCFMKGLETVERERQWPVRSAKLMLRAALMALARHYAPPAPPGRPRRHSWGSEGFRPDISGLGKG